MRTLAIQLGRLLIEHDRGYGIDRRTGWSVAVNGSFRVQLKPWLPVALWKAWRY